mmetsp:Transcript_15067/g.45163  ORF Transcript_15067/g.45163 Transcript_15067/m.45163 type:complete len:247 (-) Transcript_15067:665-1405(-)
MVFLASPPVPNSMSFSDLSRRRIASACFLCSWESFRAAMFLRSCSCPSCWSRTLHHSPRNLAVSASSARSRWRCIDLRAIWAARLFWMSSFHLRCDSSFARRFDSSAASFSLTWFSTRSSSLFCIAANALAWFSIIRLRAACFEAKTSSSFCLRSMSIFAFLSAYSWILSFSRCRRRASSALICLRYSLACCVSLRALTAWPRLPFSAIFSPAMSSCALRRRSSPSSIPSSTSRYLFSLYSASCSF